ncbi:MAG: response regulator, partial [Desulfarculaceae bacterium]
MVALQDRDLFFLIVDDQFSVRRMVSNFLKAGGYSRFREAADGADALEVLNNQRIDFIVCDWNMPNLNGLELLKKVRADESLRETPFLMVTAEVAEEVVAEAIEEGVDDYITKPFNASTLIKKIQGILARRRNPRPLDMALREGAYKFRTGDIDDAQAHFQRALEIAPQSPRAHLAMGEVMEAAGKEKLALDHYQSSLNAADRFVKAHDHLANLYLKLDQPEKALTHLHQAAKISPRNPKRQMELGKVLFDTGDKEKAVEAFEKAALGAESDIDLATELGEYLLAADLNEQAAEAFQAALGKDPTNVHAYNRLG